MRPKERYKLVGRTPSGAYLLWLTVDKKAYFLCPTDWLYDQMVKR